MENIQIPKRFWEYRKWACERMSELVAKYPDKWIAMFNKKVITANRELEKAEDEAREKRMKNISL